MTIRSILKKHFIKVSVFVISTLVIIIFAYIFLYRSGAYLDFLYKCKNKEVIIEGKRLVLKDNHFHIESNKTGQKFWESNKDYKVKDYLYCDIDGDNENEILLLLWKKGKFGSYKPFFANDDESKWSQHIFIYDYDGNSVKPIWCSSYISVNISEMTFDEINKILNIIDNDNGRSRFKWMTWGLDSIAMPKFDYDEKNDEIKTLLTINAVGDNLIHHQIYEYGLYQNDKSFDYLYENIQNELTADINAINQETMFVEEKDGYSDFPNFGTPLEVGDAMIKAGFNLITLANNHTLDRENKGVIPTFNFYNGGWKDRVNNVADKNKKVNFIGISNNENVKVPYKIIKKEDLKVSIFNYTYNVNRNSHINFEKELPYVNDLRDERQVRRDLEEGIRKSDISIVFVHWGTEYDKEIDNFQKRWADIFLKSGVDIVIGTHPHVLQKYEVLKDSIGNEMLVYYSLGNFVSYQSGIDRLTGGMAKIKLAKTNHGIKFINYELKNIITYKKRNYTTVYILDDMDNND